MSDQELSIEKNKRVISSGNQELDSKMGGGIPVGSLVLVEGVSGAGKSVLSQQIIRGSLQSNYTVTLFTSENTVKTLISQMQSIDLDVLDFLLLGKLKVYPMELAHLKEQAPFTLLQAMKKEKRQDIIIIDSFTSAITQNAQNLQVMSFFEECKRLCGEGLTIFIIVHAQVLDGDLIGMIRSMCDAHLYLRSEQDGQRLVKTLEVAKIRGASSTTGAIIGFEVEPGWGMRVIPISKARG